MDPGQYFPNILLTLAAMTVTFLIFFVAIVFLILKKLRLSVTRYKSKNPWPRLLFPLWLIWEVAHVGEEKERPARDT